MQRPKPGATLRRYVFIASRDVEGTQGAEICVIATSEDEAREKAQVQIDDGEADWWEPEIMDEGDGDLTLDSEADLTDEEIEAYREEQRVEEENAMAAEQRASRRRNIHSILTSLRSTASEEERASLIDDLERTILEPQGRGMPTMKSAGIPAGRTETG